MRTAHDRAAQALAVNVDGQKEAWGWRGRTLGRPVTGPDGPGWLRVVCEPSSKAGGKLWLGTEAAEKAMPAVPRPRLLGADDWVNGEYAYRAELSERVTQMAITSDGPTLRTEPTLDGQWWTELRNALHLVSNVATDRLGVRQEYLDRAMPEFLGFFGRPIETTVPAWSTAHGDLHWANLCAPGLTILDWEGWGRAPVGFDAATLHAHSLLVPRVAERVREELGDVLNTSAGRFSELAVITMLLQTTTRGDNLDLTAVLRERAAYLMGA